MKLKDYKNYLLINGNAISTINNYISKIKEFLKYVKVENINEKNIIKFLLIIKDKSKSSTVNIYRSAIISFVNGFLKQDIKIPKQLKVDKKLPEYFTEKYFKGEIIPVIQSIFANPLKIQAIMYLMFYTGIRVGEVGTIKRKDINFEKREIKIYVDKRNEERIIFFNKETRDILKGFFASEAEKVNAFNIETDSIRKYFYNLKKYFKDINFHPHLFRHSFARMFLMKGGSLSDLQEALGHKSINSTMIYAGLKTEQRKQIYDKIMKRKIE